MSRKAIWKSDTQFNCTKSGAPVFNNVEIIGSGDSAYLALKAKAEPTENIPFTTPANYTYDAAKVEITGGKAKLKAFVASENNWPFTVPGNYTYDANKIEVVGGKAKLKGTPYLPYVQYHLNESTGVNVPDSSGNGRDGTCIQMEDGDWVAGKLNNCLRFNEGGTTDEYVNCGVIAGFERTDSFSVEFWIKVIAWPTGNIRVVWKYANSSSKGYLIYITGGSVSIFFLSSDGRLNLSGGTTLDLNTWYHAVVTYDGTSLASGVEIYINGNKETKIIHQDDLADTILNTQPLCLGGTSINYALDGYLDEVVIYEKVLVQSEIDVRYNSGNGSENFLGAYAEDDPSIIGDNGFPFTNPLGAFTETATKPESEIKYHMSCDDGVTWQYWNGSNWVATDDSYAQANTVAEVNAHINSLSGCGNFKFRALLHSDTGATTPELDNIYVAEGVSYTLTPQEVVMNNDIQPAHVYLWLLATELVNKPTNTDIKYQYSIDGGTLWNGSWLTAAELESGIQAINCIGTGVDTLKIKVLLSTTDSLQTPDIDNLAIKYHTGYEDTGSYTSTKYFPITYWNGISFEEISFSIESPTGTTITVHARVVEEVLEENYSKPWTQYASGNSIDICGYLIQWYVDMVTTDPKETPKLNWIEVEFCNLAGQLVKVSSSLSGLLLVKNI